MDDKYISGVCNIGPAEISNRKLIGWAGLVLVIVLYILFSYLSISAGAYLILFFPALASSIGFIQAYNHFCVNFGWRGLFNFGDKVGKTETVVQKEFRKKDQTKAIKLTSISLFISIIIAVIAFLLHI